MGDWAKQNDSQDTQCSGQNLKWVGRKSTDDYNAVHSNGVRPWHGYAIRRIKK